MPKSLFPQATPETRARLEQDPTLKLFNDYDWASNPLGPIPTWPDGLKGAIRTMMVSATPMAMMVGPQGILIYNNHYAEFAGPRHPGIFGLPVAKAWPEVADFNRDNIERGLRGEGITLIGEKLLLNRHGEAEAVWLDLHYSPVLDEAGLPLASVCVVNDVTTRVLAEQALARSEERMALAIGGTDLVGTWDWDISHDRITVDDQFAALHNLDPLRAGLGVPLQTFLRAVHPDDVQRLGDELAAALRDGTPFKSEYRLLERDGTVTWVVASGRPRLDGSGKVYRFPGVAIDVTEQHRVAEALAESELQFRTLTDAMPQMIWSTGADGYHDYYNAGWYDFTGLEQGAGQGEAWTEIFHPEERKQVDELWRESLKSGEPFQVEYRLRHRSGEYRWALCRALPVRDASGHVARWIGTCTDIHESRMVAEERELVAQELSHRIKNIFAVLNGIISLSARTAPESKNFADQLRQRIYALGEAHDFVRPHTHLSGVPEQQGRLSALIERLMRPYNGGEGERVSFQGDDAEIDDAAATPLALLFHELATNAAKYGALSTPEGRVSIAGEQSGAEYRLLWRERGGPAVAEPNGQGGFGSRLVSLSVEGQMRGTLERHWRADGLEIEVVLPGDALSRSSRLRSSEDD
ncbi:MAG: hypothetical protein ABS75_05020 [Pelagibacterium sp. SCN 63-23]|nr:MAG: hypothetical protein ABS75_05020 [Pelagibacterium sp. SCN 63-23]